MPNSCSVPGCRGNYRKGPRVSVFNFPRDEQLRKEWLFAIRRKNFSVTKVSKVCIFHFKESDLEKEISAYDPKTGRTLTAPLSHVRLKKGAIPSIFPDIYSSKSPSKDLPDEQISLEKEQPSFAAEKDIDNEPPDICHFKDKPQINRPVKNLASKNTAKKQGKRKRKELPEDTISNEENVSLKMSHPFKNPEKTLNENSKGKNLNSSKDSQSEPNIKIRDVQSVSNSRSCSYSAEKVDKGTEKINKSSSIFEKPLKIRKRDEIFGKLIASEISDLSENPELYLKTKRAVLNVLVQAHFELMKCDGTI